MGPGSVIMEKLRRRGAHNTATFYVGRFLAELCVGIIVSV
jgi:hypothetical protein